MVESTKSQGKLAIAPALKILRLNLARTLKEGGRGSMAATGIILGAAASLLLSRLMSSLLFEVSPADHSPSPPQSF